jgi:hypothetical protein
MTFGIALQGFCLGKRFRLIVSLERVKMNTDMGFFFIVKQYELACLQGDRTDREEGANGWYIGEFVFDGPIGKLGDKTPIGWARLENNRGLVRGEQQHVALILQEQSAGKP